MQQTRWILLVFLFGALGAACSDDAKGGEEENPPVGDGGLADAGPGMGDMMTGPVPPGSRELQIQGERTQLVSLGERGELQVRYVDSSMRPVANGRIDFALYDNMNNDVSAGFEGTGLSARRATTNAQGAATIELIAGDRSVEVEVEATAEGADPVRWAITVGRAGTGGIEVTVLYDLDTNRYNFNQFSEARVDVFDQQNCDILRASAQNLQGAYFALPAITPYNDVDNTTQAGDFDDGTSFSVAATLINQAGNVVAFGCADAVQITGGMVNMLEISATDLPLEYKGRFDAVSRFDLTDLLRNSGNETLGTVADVLDIVRTLGNGDGDRGAAIANLFCDVLNIEGGTCTLVSRIGGPVINRLFEEFVPPTLLTILTVLGDVTAIVGDLTVVGQIEFTNSFPDEAGVIAGNDNRWQKFRFDWRNNCPRDCQREFTIGNLDVENRPVAGVFEGTVAGNDMAISEHSLNFRYGLIIIGLAEQWLIPVLLDSNMDVSLAEMLQTLIPCDRLENSQDLCEDILVTALADVLVEQLGQLNFDADQFSLSGTATVGDANGDLKVDILDEGVWKGQLRLGEMSIPFRGCFKACRDMECEGAPCEIPAE